MVKRNPEKYNAHISYKGCIEDFTWVSRMSTVDQFNCIKAGNHGARTVVGDDTFVHCCFEPRCNKEDIAKVYMKRHKKRKKTKAGQKVMVIFDMIIFVMLLVLFVID